MALERNQNSRTKLIVPHILSSCLNDARTSLSAVCQKDAEIKIMGKNHESILTRPIHDL